LAKLILNAFNRTEFSFHQHVNTIKLRPAADMLLHLFVITGHLHTAEINTIVLWGAGTITNASVTPTEYEYGFTLPFDAVNHCIYERNFNTHLKKSLKL
jgi:hypothetical protein